MGRGVGRALAAPCCWPCSGRWPAPRSPTRSCRCRWRRRRRTTRRSPARGSWGSARCWRWGSARRRLGCRTAAAAGWLGLAAIALATHGFRRGHAVPGPGRAGADARRGRADRRGDERTAAGPDPRAHAAARCAGRSRVVCLVRLALARARVRGRGVGPLPGWGRGAVALASLLPAWLTFRWVEEPLRRSTLHVRRPRVTLAAGLAGPAAVVGVGIALSAGIASPPALAAADGGRGAGARAHGKLQRSATALRPRPRDAGADRGRAYCDGCLVASARRRRPLASTATATPRRPSCCSATRTPCSTSRRWCRSRAARLAPRPPRQGRVPAGARAGAVSAHATREPRLRQVARVRAGADRAGRAPGARRRRLVGPLHRARRRPEARPRREHARAGRRLRADARATARRGRAGRGAHRRAATAVEHPRRASRARCGSSAAAPSRAARRWRGRSRSATPSHASRGRDRRPTNQFCLRDVCPAVVGNVLVYRNSGHITASYMDTMRPWLERTLRETTARSAAIAR